MHDTLLFSKGAKELIVDANPRLSIFVPGQKQRIAVIPAIRVEGKDYSVIKVPPEAAGKVWYTSSQTRGQFSLMNISPLMSFHRNTVLVPREVAEVDELTTKPSLTP